MREQVLRPYPIIVVIDTIPVKLHVCGTFRSMSVFGAVKRGFFPRTALRR